MTEKTPPPAPVTRCRCGAFPLLTATGLRYEENAGAICKHTPGGCAWYAPTALPAPASPPAADLAEFEGLVEAFEAKAITAAADDLRAFSQHTADRSQAERDAARAALTTWARRVIGERERLEARDKAARVREETAEHDRAQAIAAARAEGRREGTEEAHRIVDQHGGACVRGCQICEDARRIRALASTPGAEDRGATGKGDALATEVCACGSLREAFRAAVRKGKKK